MKERLSRRASVQSSDEAAAVDEVPYSDDNALDDGN